jgi:hypothetical protein
MTEFGLRLSLFYTRAYNRLLEPAAARLLSPTDKPPERDNGGQNSLDQLAEAMHECCRQFHLAA